MEEIKKLESRELEIKQSAFNLIINSVESYEIGAGMLSLISGIKKEIMNTFKPIKDKQNAALKETREQEAKHLTPVTEAENQVKTKMLLFKQQEDARIARENAEMEKKIKAQQDEAKLNKAVAAETRGSPQEADRIMAAPTAPIPVLSASLPKVKGFHTTKTIDFRIVDPALVPRDFCIPDEAKIRNYGKAMGLTAKVAGVEFYEKETPVSR